ncbi:MAG: HYR domain-containing protein, partial [Phaeodactylibacter sp.]|nr:HYR domain-containing protein [Phaeodactylibacter sp.]
SGSAAEIAAAVNTVSNWTTNNTLFSTFPWGECTMSCATVNPNDPCLADAGDLFPQGPISLCEGDDTPVFTANYDADDENDPNMGAGGLVGPLIYEIRIDQPSNDDDEYFELIGTPGLDLSDYTYLVIGDGAGGSGVIESVTPLTGQSIPASGYFVAAMSTFTLGTADLTADLNFENSDNVTHLLVKGFTGADGDDLDTDDDGVLDVLPWTSVQDAVALIEEVGAGDEVYAASLGFSEVGPDGTFVPGHVYFDGLVWNIGPFDPVGGADTPGSGATPAPSGISYIYLWVVTDGSPDYNIIAVEQGALLPPYGASFSGLAPGIYCVHGLSFLGTLGEFLAEGFTTGQEILTAILDQDICADLEVELCIPLAVVPAAVADAGPDQLVCEGDQIFVGAYSNGASGSWSGGAGSFADASMNFTEYIPDPSEAGTTVTLTWTTDDPDGVDGPCTGASDDVNITILEAPDAEFSYDMDEYCPNGTDPILSHVTGTDGLYTYSVVSGGPTLALDPQTGAISLAGSDQGTYQVTNTVGGCGNLVISGLIDGPDTGGIPKAIEFTAVEFIPDLSIYGFGSANNGGGSDGIEFVFPAGSLAQGEHVWVATESPIFTSFFGFAPDYVDALAPSINGDDAIELFCNGVLIDLFGDQNVDGSGEPWEYTDGWAYRNSSTGPDGPTFVLGNWFFSGPNALDGEVTNAGAAVPMPAETYFSTVGGVCPNDEHTVTITIQDILAPDITCPADIEITLSPGDCGAFVNFIVTAVDNCDPNPSITQVDGGGLSSGDFFEIGEYTLMFEASDIFGNTNGCEFDVTILEYPNPVATLTCNDDVTIALDASGVAVIGAEMILEGGPYGCYDDYIVSIEGGDNLVDCGDIGFELTVSVTDPETGNYCWGAINVEDKLAPTFDCPTAPVQISCIQDPGRVLPPPAFDNCTPVEYQQIDELFQDTDACDDNTVVLLRIWIAVDEYGNISEQCLQYINIVRPDEIDFPNDIHWECTQYEDYPNITEASALHPSIFLLQFGIDPIIATGINNGFVLANTGSGVPSDVDGLYCQYGSTYADDVIATCGNTFKIIRTWTVLDWCTGQIVTGNSSGEDNIQVIKIIDSTPPSVTLAPYSVSANIQGVHPQPCRSQDILEIPVITDLCSDWTLRIFTPIGEANYLNGVDGADGAVIPAPGLELGVHIVTYQVEDACGNITELDVEVEVIDDIVPTTICDEITDVALTSDGIAIVYAETFDDGSYDNCCLDEFLVRRMDGDCEGNYDDFGPSVEFCCSDIADNPIMVVFRAVDCYGNYNDCMVEVEVEDKLPPFVFCPENESITCDEYLEELDAAIQAGDYTLLEQFGDATYGDNCEPIVDYSVSVNISSCADGTIMRSWQVTDPAGNGPVSCTQTIYVEHVSDWVVEFPANLDAVCTDGDLPDFGEP